jgi:hypothetical protein
MMRQSVSDKPERNPFVLPSDEEVFRMRDTERRMKSLQREQQSKMKVWEKTTSTAQLGRSAKVSELLDGAGGDQLDLSRRKSKMVAAAKNVLGPSGSGAGGAGGHKPEKENMAEFIAKKREMFLVQMSLDTKREEIRKLEEKAAMKEDALKKSEQMLEEDAIRFDTFLKENDKKAHDAIKMAERETKLKQDKVTRSLSLTSRSFFWWHSCEKQEFSFVLLVALLLRPLGGEISTHCPLFDHFILFSFDRHDDACRRL